MEVIPMQLSGSTPVEVIPMQLSENTEEGQRRPLISRTIPHVELAIPPNLSYDDHGKNFFVFLFCAECLHIVLAFYGMPDAFCLETRRSIGACRRAN